MGKIKAAAYMRYSSENQSDGYSIEYQRSSIEKYAQSNNIDVIAEYIDEAYSGTTDKRPDFQRMVLDAKVSHEWSQVLVFDLDRFARNTTDAILYRDLLADNGITLTSVTQRFDPSPEGELMEHIAIGMNAYYSANNAKHTHAGMKEKAILGKHCGGRPPLGYKINAEQELEPDPDTEPIVKEIFNLFELGYSYSEMANILNKKGYTTGDGNAFNKHSFSSILTQQKYTGTYTWNKTKAKNSKHQRNSHAQKPVGEQIILHDRIPPIISKEQFDRVQERLAERANGTADTKARTYYMLGSMDILKCSVCGSNMVGNRTKSHGKTYQQYICPNHRGRNCPTKAINADRLNRFVATALIKEALNNSNLEEISCQLNNTKDSYTRLVRKKKATEKAIKSLVDTLAKGYSDSVNNKLQELEVQKKHIEDELSSQKENDFAITKDNLIEIKRNLRRYILHSNDPEARALIKELVKEVQVSNEDISIKLNVS